MASWYLKLYNCKMTQLLFVSQFYLLCWQNLVNHHRLQCLWCGGNCIQNFRYPDNIPAIQIIERLNPWSEHSIPKKQTLSEDLLRGPSTGKTTFFKEILQSTADKGCASSSQTKLSSLIWSGPYQGLNKEPLDHLMRKLSKKLPTWLSTSKKCSSKTAMQQQATEDCGISSSHSWAQQFIGVAYSTEIITC